MNHYSCIEALLLILTYYHLDLTEHPWGGTKKKRRKKSSSVFPADVTDVISIVSHWGRDLPFLFWCSSLSIA